MNPYLVTDENIDRVVKTISTDSDDPWCARLDNKGVLYLFLEIHSRKRILNDEEQSADDAIGICCSVYTDFCAGTKTLPRCDIRLRKNPDSELQMVLSFSDILTEEEAVTIDKDQLRGFLHIIIKNRLKLYDTEGCQYFKYSDHE